jgi:hypothetical protein
VQRSRRLKFTVATPFAQVGSAALLGVVLSRFGRDDASGWGDLIGAVIGVIFGAGIGFGVVLVLVARALDRPLGHRVVLAVLAVPSALVASMVTGVTGFEFWVVYAGYLAVCAGLVWWYSGRYITLGARHEGCSPG